VTNFFTTILSHAATGEPLSPADTLALAECEDLPELMRVAAALRDAGHGGLVSYSRKVFIPLTQLCRDVCHYCTFAHPPRKGERAYLDRDEVMEIARAGAKAGCHEALFTLGDKPELRYRAAREELAALGHETTLSYLAETAGEVLKETGLLPHLNPGLLTRADLDALRKVSVSQGIMLESSSDRLSERGGPHFGSPDKLPMRRLATIRAAGEAAVPFTSGILIGIGETRRERIEALLALRDLHERYGHIQEIIVQNFRAKPRTRMEAAPEPDRTDHLWTIAIARLVFGPDMNIQAPPNLMPEALEEMIAAGINDWGGVSPVTPDHVNPEAPCRRSTASPSAPPPPVSCSSNGWRFIPNMPSIRCAGSTRRCVRRPSGSSTARASRAPIRGRQAPASTRLPPESGYGTWPWPRPSSQSSLGLPRAKP